MRGVFTTIDLDGDEKAISDTLDRRFRLPGDVEVKDFRGMAWRVGRAVFSSRERANGSGLES
jgi:hypothetical protein